MSVHWLDKDNMSLQMMLDGSQPILSKRNPTDDCKRKHPRQSTRQFKSKPN